MLWDDIRYALRLMRRSPGFTAVAVLSLALGIGANTAIFSLFNTVMLRTLAVSHPEQLVEFLQQYPGEPRGDGYWSWENYEYYRDHNHVFSAMTGMSFGNLTPLRMEGFDSETVVRESVVGNYFQVMGVKPAIGRLITPEDVGPDGTGSVAVLNWSFWRSRLHADAGVLGKRIFVNDVPLTVIGVAARNYDGLRVELRTDVWVPREKESVTLIGRLKPGATIEQARAEAPILFRFTIEQRAARSKDPLVRRLKVEVEPIAHGLVRVRDQYGKPLVLLMAVVALLLLLACINLASMLLARGAGRRRELAVRVGLGASRWRLLRQMLTESILLSAAGTLPGVVLAYFGADVLVRIMASGRAHERVQLQVAPDIRVLLFAAGVALLTGLLFGLAPAWYAFRTAPAAGLRQTGRAGDTRAWRMFGKALVAAQVALSVLLVAGAGLFLSHVSRLRSMDLGFRSDHVLLVTLDPSRSGYRREQLVQPYEDLLARLEAIPGVRSAAIAGCTPIQGCGASRFVMAEGYMERPEERRFTALNWVTPRYFETMGTPLIAGRDFTDADAGRPRVAIISQGMARHYFPGANPIGKHIAIDREGRAGSWYGSEEPYEVVGVVGDSKYMELRDPSPRTMYFNMFQEARVQNQLVLRTSVNPTAIGAEVRAAVKDVVKSVPVTRVTTLSEQVDAAIVPERLIATLSGAFGMLGAMLAGIGLYGLLAYTVARRTNEIGVRMALGATAGGITRMVLGDALAMVGAGVLAGVPLILWSRPLAARLVEDLHAGGVAPVVFAAAAVGAVAVLAASVPARRAAQVDPVEALRHE